MSDDRDTNSFDKALHSEKGPEPAYAVQADDRYHFDRSELDRVQRRLKQRHVQMYVSSIVFYWLSRTDRSNDWFFV